MSYVITVLFSVMTDYNNRGTGISFLSYIFGDFSAISKLGRYQISAISQVKFLVSFSVVQILTNQAIGQEHMLGIKVKSLISELNIALNTFAYSKPLEAIRHLL